MLSQYTKNVFDYKCKYEGLDESTGRKKVKLGGLKDFETKVLEFLIKSIETFYPNLKKNVEQLNENSERINIDPNQMDLMGLSLN